MSAPYRPHSLALLDYERGVHDATLMCNQDGKRDDIPAAFWFRTDIDPLEAAALDLCKGSVLDVGGGTGVHALLLQERGHPVTAIDVEAACADLFTFAGGPCSVPATTRSAGHPRTEATSSSANRASTG